MAELISNVDTEAEKDIAGLASENSFFSEKDEVVGIIKKVVSSENETNFEKNLSSLDKLLSKYQGIVYFK